MRLVTFRRPRRDRGRKRGRRGQRRALALGAVLGAGALGAGAGVLLSRRGMTKSVKQLKRTQIGTRREAYRMTMGMGKDATTRIVEELRSTGLSDRLTNAVAKQRAGIIGGKYGDVHQTFLSNQRGLEKSEVGRLKTARRVAYGSAGATAGLLGASALTLAARQRSKSRRRRSRR